VYKARVGPNRWKFLLECQSQLSKAYTKLNSKQKLWVVREGPQTILPKLWKHWGVTHIVFEKDTDAYAQERDTAIVAMAEKAGVEVIVRMGRTLFDPDDLVRKNNGKPTMSITQVEKAAVKINNGNPDKPLDSPEAIPDPWGEKQMDLSSLDHHSIDNQTDINAEHRTKKDEQYSNIMGPNNDFAIPWDDTGIDLSQAATPHRGGEEEALRVLRECIKNEEYIARFEKPQTSPADFEPQSTTLLSPHLHFGSLSVRKFWWDVQAVMEKQRKAKKPVASVPTNLPGQLLFRDMYFGAQAPLGHRFARTYGNEVVRFIDWHLQSNPPDKNGAMDGSYEVDSEEAEEWFQRWKQGRTGFPWIDALMRQLRQEGWIHHLGRHSVACFLTRGGCYVSWERGAEVFEELLIDRESSFPDFTT
jgi:cryptochrome